jgi:hypothetical protein
VTSGTGTLQSRNLVFGKFTTPLARVLYIIVLQYRYYSYAIVEAAWERLCAERGLLDEWRVTLQRSVDAVRHYIQWHTMAVLEDRLSGRMEWPPVQDSGNSAIATTSSTEGAIEKIKS